jgi:glutathione S-transferase
VLVAQRWILACLRHRRFFGLDELNAAIAELLEQLNTRAFQKLEGSRRSAFETIDRPAMKPLPPTRYERADWKKASRLDFVAKSLVGKAFLLGDRFSVADGYVLYVLRTWSRFAKGDLPPGLADYHTRIVARPAVQAALEAEGLS